MAFSREDTVVTPTRTPATIGAIVTTFTQVAGSTSLDEVAVRFQVFDTDGLPMRHWRVHNLLPEMTPAQVTNQTTFMNNLRAKIVAEVIP